MASPLRVYVAASSTEIDRAEQVMAALRAAGCEVVSDWPERLRACRAKGGHVSDATVPIDDAEREAVNNIERLCEASVLCVLAGAPSFGAGFEMGLAVSAREEGRDLHIIAAGHGSVFLTAADDRFTTDAEAIEWCARRVAT